MNASTAWPSPAVAEFSVGVPGAEDAATGVTLLLAEVAVPAELLAVTVQVYAIAFVIPVTVIGLLEPVTDRVVAPVAEQSPL
ncbi:hypothetical protein [Rhizobacter sp. OV335]|uniref:hypothetical protein n=1 Tax=Rhizobacter sp. OV335 TaxID=1500264 RepID=UPI0013565A49|nr:hypothetical protein [Rhizobacter sp. OV335]